MFTIYILIQFICMILICIETFNSSNLELLNIIKFIPILTNLIMCLNKKINMKLKLFLIFVTIADFIFIFMNSCMYGLAIFLFVQTIYLDYITKQKNKLIYLIPTINLILVYLLKEKMIVIEGIIYAILLIYNIILTSKNIKNNEDKKILRKSLSFLLVCDIIIFSKFVFNIQNTNVLNILNIFEWIIYLISQIYFVLYATNLYESSLYKFLQPILVFILKNYYRPTLVNKEYIPSTGSAIIAGNHKHALDPLLVNLCTKRVVHTLAKKDLHDGPFGWFFRAIGTIPVDLRSSSNKSASNTAVEKLKEDKLINLSPEAKRNYTNELLLPFKYGAVSMAKKTNSMIIPYSITGDYKLFSKNLKIVFGKPIDVSNLEIEEANEKLYNAIKKLLKENMDKEELKTKKISKYRGVVKDKTKTS